MKITIVEDSGLCECMYIDGVVWCMSYKDEVRAADIAAAADGKPFVLEVLQIEGFHKEWPKTLKDATKHSERRT